MVNPFAGVVAEGRELIRELVLFDTCDVVRVTPTQDEGGGQTTTVVTVAAGVPCRYTEDFSVREQQFVARFGNAVSARLVVPAGTDIRETDRITNVTVDGTLLTRLVNDAPVPVTFGVRAVPRKAMQVSQTVYIGRL